MSMFQNWAGYFSIFNIYIFVFFLEDHPQKILLYGYFPCFRPLAIVLALRRNRSLTLPFLEKPIKIL